MLTVALCELYQFNPQMYQLRQFFALCGRSIVSVLCQLYQLYQLCQCCPLSCCCACCAGRWGREGLFQITHPHTPTPRLFRRRKFTTPTSASFRRFQTLLSTFVKPKATLDGPNGNPWLIWNLMVQWRYEVCNKSWRAWGDISDGRRADGADSVLF